MRAITRVIAVSAGILILSSSTACRTFKPTPIEQVPFRERAQTQARRGVTVTVSVLSAEEAEAVFDVNLYKKKIQPVWLEITNGTDQMLWFLPRSVDPEYHSAFEVAQKSHWTWSKKANLAKREFFFLNQIPYP